MALDRAIRDLGTFRTKEALAAGIHERDLYAMRDSGELIELSRGVFKHHSLPNTAEIDFVALSLRAPRGMVCLRTALSYWDLSDEFSTPIDFAIPRGSWSPTIDFPPTANHTFNASTFDIGRIKLARSANEYFFITDRERTVVDAFKWRNKLGHQLAYEALRRYLSLPKAKPSTPS